MLIGIELRRAAQSHSHIEINPLELEVLTDALDKRSAAHVLSSSARCFMSCRSSFSTTTAAAATFLCCTSVSLPRHARAIAGNHRLQTYVICTVDSSSSPSGLVSLKAIDRGDDFVRPGIHSTSRRTRSCRSCICGCSPCAKFHITHLQANCRSLLVSFPIGRYKSEAFAARCSHLQAGG